MGKKADSGIAGATVDKLDTTVSLDPSRNQLRSSSLDVEQEQTELGKAAVNPDDPDGDGHKELRNTKWSQNVKVKLQDDTSSGVRRLGSYIGTYCARLHTLRIPDMALLEYEEKELIKEANLGPRAVQVICWRRTLLEVSLVCYFCNLLFAGTNLMRAVQGDYKDFGDGKVFGMELGDYTEHFQGYVVAEYFYQSANLGAHALAFCFCICGLRQWRTWSKSVGKTGLAYAVGYVTPFFLLMVIPFHLGIDIKGIQSQFCNDIIDGAPIHNINDTSSWAPQKFLQTLQNSKLPGTDRLPVLDNTTTTGLRSFLASYGIMLPTTEEFCSFDPDVWEPYVQNLVKSVGRLSYDNGTCPAAQETVDMVYQQGQKLAANASHTLNETVATCERAPCDVCGSDACLTLLPTLEIGIATAYSYALAFNSTGEISTSIPPEVALAYWGIDAYSSASACFNCMTGSPTCAALCLPVWASGQATYNATNVSSAAVAQLSMAYSQAVQFEQWSVNNAKASLSKVCIDTSALLGLKVLLGMTTATRPFQTMLGLKLSVRALGALLPTTFAMMLGAFKGACIAKTVVPYSRVPGTIIIAAVVFSMPHLTTLIILVKSILGDFMILISLSFFLFANMVYLPAGVVLSILGLNSLVSNGIIEPDGFEGAYATMERRQRYALIFNLLFVLFLVIWFFWSAPLEELMELGLVDVDFADMRSYVGSKDFWKTICVSGLDIVTKMYGLTKISQVFFSDMSLYATLLVDEADNSARDRTFRKDHGEKEEALLAELHEGLELPEGGFGWVRKAYGSGPQGTQRIRETE